MNDFIEIEKKLDFLKEQHETLDRMIDELSSGQFNDQLQLHRLKKERLALRDQISQLEDILYPDIIA
jgi:hypothetical protein